MKAASPNSDAIVRPEDVTTAWMTRVLGLRGIDAKIESLRAEVVIAGYMSEARRFHITYRGAVPPGAPATVFGKFTAAEALAAESGKKLGFYRPEVMFYRELAHRTKIRTPLVYLAEIDEEDNFALLFEDLAPAKTRLQVDGCTIEEARQALKEAALLHSAFWNDRELITQPWLSIPKGAQGIYPTSLIESSWAYVKKEFPDRMSKEVIAVCEKFVRNHAYWNRPRNLPKCFSHNDFRPENMLFGGVDGRIAVVDWQTSSYLGVGMDPAYFLGAIFDRETRKANERALLKGYYDDLVSLGVAGYSFDRLLRDYAHYSMAQLAVAIAGTCIVNRSERGDTLFMHMIKGAALQALDNDALDDLPD
jgi:hypothetical protein